MNVLEKINSSRIIKSHFETLYNLKTKKIYWAEVITFYISPIFVVTFLVWYFEHCITEKLANLLFQGFAITGGFLINALVMLMDRRQNYDDSKKFANRVELIKETFANTSFGVLICFIIVLLAGIAVATDSEVECVSNSCVALRIILTSLTYYFSIIFIHTLGMVIKRLDRIFRE
jgi:chromate transport protein ChrA